MHTVLSSKGQVVLPVELRRQDHLHGGESFSVRRLGHGKYQLTRQARPKGSRLLSWLQSCPSPGYFQPIPSESTDRL